MLKISDQFNLPPRLRSGNAQNYSGNAWARSLSEAEGEGRKESFKIRLTYSLHYHTFLITFLLISELFAQTTSNFDIFQYRSVGPTRGGRVTAVAGIASHPGTFYMGATGGGVWKTKDYGTTWQNISDGFFSTPSIGAISVAQNDANIIYVGTGTDGLRSNIITGKGVYKSIDAGETWQFIGLKNTGQIGAVEIHPTDHNTVFVAAIGQAFQPNSERGIFRTRDGGVSWEKVFFISDTTGMVDIEFMPSNPNIIYASAWRAERKPWTIISGGKENGIFKSIDGGDTWKKIDNGLPKFKGKIDLAVSPSDSKILYALVEARGKQGALYKSIDQGESFVKVSDKMALLDRPFYYTNIEVDPTNADIVYVLATRFHKSIDGGKTWKELPTPHGDNHDIWINPNNPQLYIQSNDGGANVTHNGGETWSSQFNQSTAELYQVEVDNQYPYWLYGGQQDNYSTIAVPSLPPHNHQAGAVGFITDAGGCETGPAVPHPDNPDIVYSNCKGRFSVYNKATGQEQRYDVYAAYMYGYNPKNLKFRFQRVSPIHISPHDSRVIYHASQFVHKTTDEGKSWELISPDLTAFEADKQVRSGSPITNDITGEEFYSAIYSLRESPLEKGLIWVGANDGPIHITRNGGESWKNVTPKKLPKGGRVDSVEPSPHQAGKAIVTVLRYQLGDWRPYIFRTTDYGNSWRLITKGIPTDYPVRVVREDPDVEGLLYAGTEFGMFISFDDGNSWQVFQQNLPITPITDIKVHRKELAISTMGRGFYVLDNLSTLHQNLHKQNPKEATLFKPQNTIRYRYPSFRDVRTAVPSPKYPKPSVIIDYYLPDSVAGGIQLSIHDADGKTIRSFTSDAAASDTVINMMSTNQNISLYSDELINTRGAHRFHWDLKHSGAWHKNNKRRFQGGPYAAPGSYSVQLRLGNKTLTQKFELMADPRVLKNGVTNEDMKKQEILALGIVNLLTTARQKAQEIEQAMGKLKPKQQNTRAKLATMKSKLVREEGRYTKVKFINQVEYLQWIVQRGDQLPGRDAYERFEELKALFNEITK